MHAEKGPLNDIMVWHQMYNQSYGVLATWLEKKWVQSFPKSTNLTNNLLLITIHTLFIASFPMHDMSSLESNTCKMNFKTFQEVVMTTQKAVTSFSHLWQACVQYFGKERAAVILSPFASHVPEAIIIMDHMLRRARTCLKLQNRLRVEEGGKWKAHEIPLETRKVKLISNKLLWYSSVLHMSMGTHSYAYIRNPSRDAFTFLL